jgi:DNA-binding SARP family transcriptional activator
MDGARRAGTKAIAVRLLGPIEAELDGVAVGLGGPKPRALLTVLALDLGRVVSVDTLVEALWPGDAPDTASHAVQVYVSQLRKALGPVLATRPPGYVLDLEPDSVDVHRFTRLAEEGRAALRADAAEAAETSLREALALWRGPALADFQYEPFAQTEIARLEELRTVVVEERIEADLALGRHAELVSELEALVQVQAHRERPRAQLMLALYRSGRQADALAAYRAARDALVDELGIEPGPELKELETAILRQDGSLLLDAATPAKPPMQFRRLASILFVNVVESMALGERLDPEALGFVQRRYFETVSAAVTRHGGTVEKYAGDAVIAAFGVPVSHEDDALRAASAAFEIQAGVEALNERLAHDHGIALEIRIGIAAGEVVATSAEGGQRFVAGDSVGVAARLQHEAQPGEIVVGEVVARLIDHAARLEPRGVLEIPGRNKPFGVFLLQEITPAAPAFERRLDAKLVGRKRELAAIRKGLKRAVGTRSPGLVVVTGPAGIGKSRLAAEVASRAKDVTRLSGRCLSYGDGITYWPLREVLDGAAESDERDAVVEALESETPPPAPEVAWLFRQFCEVAAREQPLVLVFDDAHWAEPTFLELVEHLVDRGVGPILVVCVAREELLEDRPAFVEERRNTTLVELDSLSREDADALLDGLAEGILETDRRDRIVEAAEGNPFFLEQLLAFELEGGLAGGAIPETILALLAARLDRLGPGERAVLERGAVIGKAFRLDDVAALLDPEASPTAEAHLRALSARGFVRPEEPGEFAFRHVLLQEAVYRAAPKRLRADLHERFIDRFEERRASTGDVDEFAGYHLEQAYRLRKELGESDRRTAQLGEDAGRRLGEAGFGALKRGDMPATVNLLARAVSLLPPGDATRCELMCELGVARHATGDHDGARAAFVDAIAGAEAEGHRRIELRARIEAAYGRLLAEPEGAAQDLLAVAEAAIPTFEAFEDSRSLARAWLLIGYVRGGIHGDHAAWEEAEERALGYYRRTEFPPATCMQQIAAAIYWGPTPVPQGIERLATLLEDETLGRFGHATVAPFLGGLYAQAGEFATARGLITEAEHTLTGFGAATTAFTYCGTVRADVELLAGDLHAAEATLREQCDHFERVHDRAHLAVRAAKLAEALFRQRRWEECEHWVLISRSCAASDDQSAQLVVGAVEAKLLAAQGAVSDARELAEDTVRLADRTDGLNLIAFTRLALGEVLRTADLHAEARRAVLEAVDLFERKGNSVAAAETRDLLDLEVPA